VRFEYRSTCFLAVGLLLASCGSGRTDGGVDDPAAPPAITAIDVPPFRVHGDGTREEVAAQALRIETVAALLQRDLFEQAPGPTVDIWLFTDADSTARYTREVFGREPEPAEGFYSPGERAIVVDLSARDGGVEHFVVHAFVQAGFERCPVWLDEGLASLFEVWAEREGRIVGLVDGRLGLLQEDLRAGVVADLEAFTAQDRAGFHGGREDVNQRVARYLCLYLQEQGMLREYWRGVQQAEDDPSGFRTLLRVAGGDEPGALLHRWTQWVLSQEHGR